MSPRLWNTGKAPSPRDGLAIAVGASGRTGRAWLTEGAVLAGPQDGAVGPLPAHLALLRAHLEDHPIDRFQVQAQLAPQGAQLGQRHRAQVPAAPQPRQHRGRSPALQLLLQPPELRLHLLLLLQGQLPGTVGRQRALLGLLGLPLPRVTGLEPGGPRR